MNAYSELPAFAKAPAFAGDSAEINAVVETPEGSRNKFTFDPQTGLFTLGAAMPAGVVFPFEFGFIPSTLGGDGDPLDLLLLLDAPTFPGCLVRARLLGVIEAEQTVAADTTRNDRLIGVPLASKRHQHIGSLEQLPAPLLDEIEHFFVSYNAIRGKRFKVLGRFGPERAVALVEQGADRVVPAGII